MKFIEHFPTNVFSHFVYVANFAGSIDSLAWNGDLEQDRKTELIVRELEHELSVMSHFKTNGTIIHPGAFKDRKLGLETIAKSINKINFVKNSNLLLENSAGEGNKLCRDFKEIKMVIDNVDISKRKHVGVCLDTAHIWGQGDYDLSKVEEIDRMFEDFDRIIGLEKFKLLHLNDSEVPKGSKKDRHASLGEGCIWKDSFDSLKHLLNRCEKNKTAMVLETPDSETDMNILLELQPKF